MGSFIWPCPSYTGVTSPFGNRSDGFHWGVDLGCAIGRPIIAARGGTVSISSWHDSYGNYVQLNHGGGVYTLYAHASKLLVSVGATVKAGQQIALIGSTGNSSGPHLHFEIKIDGTKKNPLNYVSDKDTVSNYTGGEVAEASSSDSSGPNTENKAKEITSIVVKSSTGSPGAYKLTALRSADAVLASGCEIMIQENAKKMHIPVVEGEITLQYERKGSPGVLTFNVVKEGNISFFEGNPVSFRVDGKRIFYGYVFKKKRNKNGIITVTCYDQLRYFKNKDTLIYKEKKYSELLKTVSDTYGLKTGVIDDTEYVIPGRIEETTIFDILANASDDTVLNTGKLFVLYDDCGSICLKNIQNMLVPLLIDKETALDFDYTSSIDEQTYNRIKLVRDNGDTGERELYIAEDAGTQAYWGILQYYENTGSVGTSSSSGSGGSGGSAGATTGSKGISQTGIDLVKEFEGVRLYAYQCNAGVWTIGYGHTSGVYPGMTISQAQAEAYLKSDMAEFEVVVNSKVTVPLTQNMFDALVSFAFNVGGGALGSSTLLSLLNQGDYQGAAEQFDAWTYAGGQKLAGLARRRGREKQLFLTGYSSGGSAAKTAATSTSSTTIPDSAPLKEKAEVLLKYYNKKTRTLQITDCFGDVRVRGGSTVVVNMDIGDISLANYMVVESVKHKFSNCKHMMDIKVVGIRGEFIA